jgi:predicted nucleic acid-binding protein
VQRHAADRRLPIDAHVARTWGELMAIHQHHVIDGLIAATAIVHKLTLVSRNTKDFQTLSIDSVNPFSI